VTVVAAVPDLATPLAAITLARTLARDARVVLVDLVGGRAELAAISSDPGAPGLADLARGAASFGQIIIKDRFSPLHLVAAGAELDPDALSSPRLLMTFAALARAYDHVVVDAGAAPPDALSAGLATLAPRAVLVADGLTSPTTAAARERLLAAGFTNVTVLVGTRADWETAVAGQGERAA
jgi:MinD-like ATPase involved in chromosome partitioning or flagellar assembly